MQQITPLRVAITGASGLLGSRLARYLASSGHTVISLVRNASQAHTLDTCHWDTVRGIQELEKCEQLDAVVHLAGCNIGQRRWSRHEKILLRQSRVEATEILARQLAGLRRPPSVFVSASATGYYGNCGEDLVTEATSCGAGFLAQLAYDWEHASDKLAAAGVRVVHARLGIVLALEGGALKKLLPIFRCGIGGVLGSGTQYWSWIAIEDAVLAISSMLTHDYYGPLNVTSPHPVTNREFTRMLARVLRRPAMIPVPAWVLRIGLGEMADELLLSSCRAVPQCLTDQGFSFVHPRLPEYLAQLMDQ